MDNNLIVEYNNFNIFLKNLKERRLDYSPYFPKSWKNTFSFEELWDILVTKIIEIQKEIKNWKNKEEENVNNQNAVVMWIQKYVLGYTAVKNIKKMGELFVVFDEKIMDILENEEMIEQIEKKIWELEALIFNLPQRKIKT